MAKFKLLLDLYRFPGFVPVPTIRGVFGDPQAVVITAPAPPKKTLCGICGQEYRSHYDKRPRRVRDLSCGDKRVYLAFLLRRVQCSRCGGVKNERLDWLADNPLYTKRFAFFVGRRCRQTTYQGGGRGTVPRLARRQGTGQAVHARATPSGRNPGTPGHRHRRDRHRQGTQVSHRGQRPGAGPAHLVRRPGPLRSEPGRVLRLARPEKCGKIRLAVMDMWQAFRNSTLKEGNAPQATILYDKFHILTHLGEAMDKVRKREYARLIGQGPAVHQGAAVHAAVALGQSHGRRAGGPEAVVQGQHAAEQGLPPQGVLRTTLGLPEPAVGLAFLRCSGGTLCAGNGWSPSRSSPGWSQPTGMASRPIATKRTRCRLGFVEGLNNKIRAIQRRAYGFRDEEYLRLKILTCMLPKL